MEVGTLQDVQEIKNEENGFEENASSDPMVYQLVRVEGDGTLVPPTEDEVLQIEQFLDEKVDLPSIEDVGHVEDFFTNDCMFLTKPDYEEGYSELETAGEIHALQFDADLEGDRLKPLDVSLDLPSKCTVSHDHGQDKLNTEQGDNNINTEQGDNNILHQDNTSTETTKSTVLNDSCSAEKEKADACSRSVNNSCTGSSVSSSVPDFSILRGEVCLDNLTIRELQEAFRATFGRQTNVKDKLWLKRRITMGLTNSCDVQSSGCVVKDYKIVHKDAKHELPAIEGIPKVEAEATSLVRNKVLGPGNARDTPSCSYYQSEDQQRSSKRLKGASAEKDESQGILQDEQGSAKRLRKPTKRYIEELSDIETCDSTGKLSSPGKMPAHDEVLLRQRVTPFEESKRSAHDEVLLRQRVTPFEESKRSAHDEVLLRQRVTPFEEVDSLSITYPTRKDTFGGFSVHVPYVSRMRRGRPRRNLLSFLRDDDPSVEGTEVQMAVEVTLGKDGEQGDHVNKAMKVSLMKNAEMKGGLIEATDDDEVHAVQANDVCRTDAKPKTQKQCLKRKHHRAWTLSEVQKLVDGVARFGVGKWSEIRRLSFASYSYRTSVDLKDKWRNLIRATQTQLFPEKDGICPRKINPSIIPIPPDILVRVKELAELQPPPPPAVNLAAPIKFSGQGSKVAQGKGSGFL